MKTIFYLSLLLCSIIVMGCMSDPNEGLSESDRISNEVIIQSAAKLEEKYGLSFIGIGGGAKNGILWLMSVTFDLRCNPLTKNEARELIVSYVDDFLSDINSSEELKPHLRDVPFTAKNISMILLISDVNGKEVHHPYIDAISANQGTIMYLTRDPEKEYGFKTDDKETYEEAVNILRKEKQINDENALENESNLHDINFLQ